ncbi:MAG: methyltransferase domain-containing protein [Myxococcota bacterium]
MPPDTRQSDAVRATFDSAADHYDHPTQGHWTFTAEQTLAAAALQPGERVLDVCCGTGSTAIPGAKQVGPEGEVVGVDLSEAMLDLAREKQRAEALANVRFEAGDLLALPHPDASFDVVLCQLGIFFLETPGEGVAALHRLVRPGGRLVLTTFRGPPLAPAAGLLREIIAEETGESSGANAPNPVRAGATSSEEGMRTLAEATGAEDVEIDACEHDVVLRRPEDFWPIALGGGARGLIDRLDDAVRERVRTRIVERLRADGIDRLRWNLLLTRIS